MNQKIGVIGLGSMGSALADALLAKGVDLAVWNRSRGKCEPFSERGVGVSNTVDDLVQGSDVLLACLTDHGASLEVLEPLAGSLAGKVLVSLTTVNADEALATAAWAEKNGIDYLQGAILGYPQNVRDAGGCMIVYSGPRQVYEDCLPVLDALGGMPRLIGDRANAAACFDKAIYAAYYAHVVGLLHATALCKAAGVSLEVWREARTTGPWDWKAHDADLLERIEKRDYAFRECAMPVHASALDWIIPMSDQLGVNSELPRAIAGYLARALERGCEDCDLPALFEVMRNDG